MSKCPILNKVKFGFKTQKRNKCYIDEKNNCFVCYCSGTRRELKPSDFIKEYYKLNTDEELVEKLKELKFI